MSSRWSAAGPRRAGDPAVVEDQRPHRRRAQVERQHPRVRHATSSPAGYTVPGTQPPVLPRPASPSRSRRRAMVCRVRRRPWNCGDGTDVAGSAPAPGQERPAPRPGPGAGGGALWLRDRRAAPTRPPRPAASPAPAAPPRPTRGGGRRGRAPAGGAELAPGGHHPPAGGDALDPRPAEPPGGPGPFRGPSAAATWS